MSSTERSPAEARRHFWKLVRGARFGMFITQVEGGLRSRPLTTQNGKDDEGSTLLYFVAAGSDVVAEVSARPVAAVAYANTDDDHYVSVSGRADVVQDTELATRLWTPMAQAWFAGGAQDANLRILRLQVDAAEYWDVKSSKMVQLLRMAVAAVGGTPPNDMGEHAEVRLR